MEILIFSLNRESFGVELKKVKEIVEDFKIVHVPLAPSYVEGLTNIRGEIIPLFNLAKRFNLKNDEYSLALILESEEGPIGLLVKEIIGIEDIPEKKIKTSRASMKELTNVEYLKGIAKVDKKTYLIINIRKLIDKGG